MNRRQALKNFGLGAGILIVGPSTLSLLQSCKNDPKVGWEPTFLSAGNGFALENILEVILPATDTPGAKDLNIAQFIDSYMTIVAPEDLQKLFQRNAEAFAGSFKREFDKELENGTEEEFTAIVTTYLKAAPEQRDAYVKRLTETQDPMGDDPEEKMDLDTGSFAYLRNLRELGIWAWKNSEIVGEEVLWYDPIPGQYIPCGPVEELSNGKAMSL